MQFLRVQVLTFVSSDTILSLFIKYNLRGKAMCNDHNYDPFADIAGLEDTSEWDGSRAAKPTGSNNPYIEDISETEVPGFVEDCPKCRGTGNWRPGYPCFKCKGTGKLQFKTSPEARAKARKYSKARKQRNEAENMIAFQQAHKIEAEWLSQSDSSFAVSLLQGIAKYGHLTEKQLAAVRKCIARDDDAKAGFEKWAESNKDVADWLITEADDGNEFAGSLLAAVKRYGSLTERQEAAVRRNLEKTKDVVATDIDLSGLHLHHTGNGARRSYFAVPDGDTRLKVCIRRPGKDSRYYGWTFVDDGAAYGSRQTYGKQAPDGLYKGKIAEALKAIVENPLEAAIAYGKLTSTCGVCGKILEDPESVAAGIGPVCATKY